MTREEIKKQVQKMASINYDNEGCIVIHCEHLTDDQRQVLAEKIADFLNDNYPNLATKTIS